MKTLKFMLAAATAIGLASATQADVKDYNSTGFERLELGTNVTTGVIETDAVNSYFYYAGANAADNESTIIAAGDMTGVTRPTGAANFDEGRAKILQVSTGTEPLLRTYESLSGGEPQTATVLEGDTYVDTLVQFTVTPYTDSVTPGESDKLMIYLKESTNEVNDVLTYTTNLVVVGKYHDVDSVVKEYKVDGLVVDDATVATVFEANKWYRLTVKVLRNVAKQGTYPGFMVFIDGKMCVFDETTANLNSTVKRYYQGGDLSDYVSGKKVVLSLLADGNTAASLQAVGFAGEGKVDDIVFSDQDPFFVAVDFTFTGVSGVEATQTPGTDTWTFSAPAGSVISSVLVNGNPVAFTAGATSFEWTATSEDAGALVIVAAGKQLTAAEHPWYASPKGFVLAENLPGQTKDSNNNDAYVSAFHGQGEGEYLGLTYSTNPLQFDLFEVDGTNALTSVYNVPATSVTTPGFRGVAISKALGIAMTMAYATDTTMYAYPLAGGEPIAVTKPSTYSFDAGAFSPDGKYFFSNALNGDSSNQFYVKWSVAMTTNSLTLTKVGSITAGGRGRSMAYARINGRDLVFALAETGKVVAIDMTGDDASAWSKNDLITGLPTINYGSLCVSGVNATGATPKLTVATSKNGASYHDDVLNVYTLTVPDSGAVEAELTASFNEAALTAACFGDISDTSRYGNTVYVTDDDATIYFGRPDNKLYAGIYVPKHDITFISGEGSTTNELSVYEGDTPVAPTAAEVANKTFSAWSPAVAAATADATYTATYDWIAYTITYLNADGTTFTDFMDGYTAPASFTAETPVALPVAANVDLGVVGVQFNGWTNETGSVTSTEGLTANLRVFADISAVVQAGWDEDPTQIQEGKTAAQEYPALDGTALASADAKKLTVWAKAKEVAFADAGAAVAGSAIVEAFMLNCAPNAAAVAAEKAKFTADITVNADGTVSVTAPDGYNVTPKLQGKAALSDTTWTPIDGTPASSYKFFRFVLEL